MSYPINSFDIDGVIFMGDEFLGVYPGPQDIIVTGRSYEEKQTTFEMLYSRGIHNEVYFNPRPFDRKTRESSGEHKACVLAKIHNLGIHFEDDPIQIAVMRERLPDIRIVHLVHEFTEK